MHIKLNRLLLMGEDFILQDFRKDLSLKSKFNGKSNKCLRGIKYKHSHKKQKDSLETRAVLLIFSLKFEISGLAVQSMHQNSKKWQILLGIAQ